MEKSKQNVVLFPFMAQGHIIPFLALAQQIEQKGYTITFINTPLNIKKLHYSLPPSSSSSIKLVEIPFNSSDHGLPSESENTDLLPYNLTLRLIQTSQCLKHPFKKLISHLIESEKTLCVVSDFFFGWAADVAHELGIFHAIFNGTSAFGLACYYSLWLNLPHKRTDSVEFFLPDFPQAGKLHVTQLAFSMVVAGEEDEPMTRFQWENLPKRSNADAILFNTIEEMDKTGLTYFRNKLKIPVLAIGPVLLSEQKIVRTEEALTIIQWPDKKEEKSVIYISFGSQNTISASQMMKLAKCLDSCNRNFIWVLRPPLDSVVKTESDTEKWLPDGFLRRIHDQERGLIIRKWAPQVEILAHKSVGAFLSHCGWNSVLESLENGVPLIGWPIAAEQFYNSKLLVEEIGVCVEMGRGTNVEMREEDILEKIELVMGENEKGKEIRRKGYEIREMIRDVMRDEGDYKGSSVVALEDFFFAAKSTCFSL